MTAATSAQTSQKAQSSSRGATPFDEITALEQAEAKRVAKELEAMQREHDQVHAAVQAKEEDAEKDLRQKMEADLQAYREAELEPMINTGQQEAVAQSKSVEAASKEPSTKHVDTLVETMLRGDLLSPQR